MNEIHFPAPSASWGRVIQTIIPNPRWRWWAFWRPRELVFDMEPGHFIDGGASVPDVAHIELTEQ